MDTRDFLHPTALSLTRRSQPVPPHHSAARVWGLPILGRWPAEVHFLLPAGAKRRTHARVVWPYDNFRDDEVVESDDYLVTSRLRTMVDLARATPFASAVTTLDAGLRAPYLMPDGERSETIAREELQEAVARLGSARGCPASRVAAGFADGQSGSTGESVSRANIHLSGRPAPILLVVYPFPAAARTGSKVREDRLRAPNRAMVRRLRAVLVSPTRLRTLLIAAGLRPER